MPFGDHGNNISIIDLDHSSFYCPNGFSKYPLLESRVEEMANPSKISFAGVRVQHFL
jgi:hypothetical protein